MRTLFFWQSLSMIRSNFDNNVYAYIRICDMHVWPNFSRTSLTRMLRIVSAFPVISRGLVWCVKGRIGWYIAAVPSINAIVEND